jgi:hypothetical protein
MIPATDEDRLKSGIYRKVEGLCGKTDYFEYAMLCRKRYEEENHKEKEPRFSFRATLDEELLHLAYSHYNSKPDKHRKIDARALKSIKKHNRCSGTDPVARHFFRVYNELKRSVADFLLGNYYLEYVEEDEDPVVSVSKKRSSNRLEDSLFELAEQYGISPDDKKREVDKRALLTIRRCKGCRNSPAITRSYYKIYYQMTGRGREETEEESKPSDTSR